jgi:tetratricopeptide (TPR) repeat protein
MQYDRLQILLQYIKDDPEDPFCKYALALEYIKRNEIQEAQSILEQLISNNADYLAAYYQLGKLLEFNKMNGAAIAIYREGILIADSQNNRHTKNELQAAIDNLE